MAIRANKSLLLVGARKKSQRERVLMLLFALACSDKTPATGASDATSRPASGASERIDTQISEGLLAPASNSSAHTAPQPDAEDEVVLALTRKPQESKSLGSALEGSLQGGLALPLLGPGFRHNPRKRDEARYGTVELVHALIGAGAQFARRFPEQRVTINDLSLEHGGPITGHGSHRSGRDVDILFFLLDAAGQPFPSMAIPLEPDGTGTDYGDLADPKDDRRVRLDVATTWEFFAALLQQENVAVQRIFIAEHLRELLLRHARANQSSSAAKTTIELFADLTCQPEFPHDDHAHVRIFCPLDDVAAGCEDSPPWLESQKKWLAEHHLAFKKASRRRGEAPNVTSHEAARAAAGPMHEDVRDFLERRRKWQRQPHPGRPNCR
jgi:penicillin-insensitive murein endopeptidase